jgi:CMP/dCMP kinase
LSAFVIALDGPAASGKSTVGLGVARELGFRYFDTGLLYRALTLYALDTQTSANDASALASLIDQMDIHVEADGHVWRDRTDITPLLHSPRVEQSVSAVAAQPSVRSNLVSKQRELIQPPGLVLAGRDIGTVIVPEAPLKIWLNASVDERARRRAEQTGEPFDAVLNGMRQRDHVDASRAVAPMARAADAVEVETDGLPLERVVARIVELAHERGANA